MADVVSSIITITQVSLMMIKETVRFIQEVRLVDTLVGRLFTELNELHGLIQVVHATYKRARAGEHIESSMYIGTCLEKCKERLKEMKKLVIELASKSTNTFLRKVSVHRRYDAIKKEIELTTEDIHRSMIRIRTAMACWNLDVLSAHRQLSEAMVANHTSIFPTDLHPVLTHDGQSLERSLSNTETLIDHADASCTRRTSVATAVITQFNYSTSSSPSQGVYPQTERKASSESSRRDSANESKGWADFHYQITKCASQDIEAILEENPDASTLARSTDGLKRTPLHLAAQRDDIRMAKILLRFGADINAKDSEPASVLDFALAFNNKNFVTFLLDHGVDEKAILRRNKAKFKEMQAIINFRKKNSLGG